MPIWSDGRVVLRRFGAAVFGRSGEGARVDPGALDEGGVFEPTCELWKVRRQGWLLEFKGMVVFVGDREG